MAPEPAPVAIRVSLVEDRREIREGLAALIAGTEGFACAGTYRSMEEALPGLAARVPDVLLLDVGLPGMSGIEGIRLLRERHATLAILMLKV
jgi:DNA-binding NarL/FixJ family response regulator